MYGQRPGGRETTVVSATTEVDTPWQVMVMCIRADGVAIAAIAAFVYVVAFWITCAVTANTFILPWPPWWLRWLPVKTITLLYVVGRSWVRFWPALMWSLPAWVLIWLVAVPVHAWILVWMRGVPEQINRNYPPQYNAMDATEENLGLTFWDWWKRIREGISKPEPEPQPGPGRTVTIRVETKTTNGYREQILETPDTPQFCQFARAVGNGQTFALRTALRHHMSREEFDDLRDDFLTRGWAVWKNRDHPQQGVNLLAVGKRALQGAGDEHSPTPPERVQEVKSSDAAHARTDTHDIGEGEEG